MARSEHREEAQYSSETSTKRERRRARLCGDKRRVRARCAQQPLERPLWAVRAARRGDAALRRPFAHGGRSRRRPAVAVQVVVVILAVLRLRAVVAAAALPRGAADRVAAAVAEMELKPNRERLSGQPPPETTRAPAVR